MKRKEDQVVHKDERRSLTINLFIGSESWSVFQSLPYYNIQFSKYIAALGREASLKMWIDLQELRIFVVCRTAFERCQLLAIQITNDPPLNFTVLCEQVELKFLPIFLSTKIYH